MENKQAEKLYFNSGHNTEFEVEISIDNPNFLQTITKKTVKKYKVKALNLNTIIKITDVFLEVPEITDKLTKKLESPSELYLFINQNLESLVKVVGIILNENIKFLKNNLTIDDIKNLIIKIISMINVSAFFFCMSSIRANIALQQD